MFKTIILLVIIIKFAVENTGISPRRYIARTYKHALRPIATAASRDLRDAQGRIRRRTMQARKRGINFMKDTHFYTEFYSERSRHIYNDVYNPETRTGLLVSMIDQKTKEQQRCIRVWSAGSSYGLELLTLAWLTRQALVNAGENIEHWQLDFFGTDNVKDVVVEAEKNIKKARSEYKNNGIMTPVTVDTDGLNIEFFIVDHFDTDDQHAWALWQNTAGGFDIIFMRNTPVGMGAEGRAQALLSTKGIFVGSNGIVKVPDVGKETAASGIISVQATSLGEARHTFAAIHTAA